MNGAFAGIVGTLAIYPLDLVKTRLQNQGVGGGNLIYKNGIDCFKKIVLENGPRGLYRGLSANLLGVTPEKAIKLAVNDQVREYFCKRTGKSQDELAVGYGVIAGASAGFCQVFSY